MNEYEIDITEIIDDLIADSRDYDFKEEMINSSLEIKDISNTTINE